MKSITIIARRRNSGTFGNTYFSARCLIDGVEVDDARLDLRYGYGDHYIDSMADRLDFLGLLPGLKTGQPLRHYCEENNIAFYAEVVDVARRRDL
jgi:hypothetical protein